MLIEIDKPENVTGVVHVGAHTGEEQKLYDKWGVPVIWIEAIQDLAFYLDDRYYGRSDIKVICAVVSDKVSKVNFNITSNKASSSILELGTHTQHHPKVVVEKVEKRTTSTLDSLVYEDYNFLNLDIQGAELLALKGYTEGLKHTDYVYTEVNTEEVYKGCALLPEIDAFLAEFGFKRKEMKITKYGWGDAYYEK